MRRRRRLVAASIVFALGLLAGALGPTFASFAGATSNGSNSFSADTDFTPPSITAGPVIDRSGDCSPNTTGFVHQGGAYFVYANATDTGGNPSSGVSTVTADASNVTASQSSASMTTSGGPWTVASTSYNYRSSSITADNPLAAGSKNYSVTATDAHSNSTNASASVTVDDNAPSATDVQTTNKTGGTQGKAEQNDTITFTFSETIEPCSILSGWDGTSTNVSLHIGDNTGTGGFDKVTIYQTDNTTVIPLGTVTLGANNYVKGSTDTIFNPSTMVQTGSAITITLGTLTTTAGNVTTGGAGNMVWTPSATANDPAGNACSTTTRTETGASDKDF